MKFFKRLTKSKSQNFGPPRAAVYNGNSEPKSRSRLRLPFLGGGGSNSNKNNHANGHSPRTRMYGADPTKTHGIGLPKNVLENILAYVAPHIDNYKYLPAEEVFEESDCVLCDIRDLAHAALVCQEWFRVAQPLLYRIIRLEVVHYCPLEEDLMEKRKRRSFFQTDPDQVNVALERMKLLVRSLEGSDMLGAFVHIVRMQFMTREAQRQDLVKLVSYLPNLRFIDLPAGFYRDDPSCQMLKALMYQRCPELRRMRWNEGSEAGFVGLCTDRPWIALENITLSKVRVDDVTVLTALTSLPKLREVTLEGLHFVTDGLLETRSIEKYGYVFPSVHKLSITDCGDITVRGITSYLSRPDVAPQLRSLDLAELKRVQPQDLYLIMNEGPGLDSLRFTCAVTSPFPEGQNIPYLQSDRLKTLFFEIRDEVTSPKPAIGVRSLDLPAASYYSYMCKSVINGQLLNLTSLYVHDPRFPKKVNDSLEYAPSLHILTQLHLLTVYSKNPSENLWISSKVGEEGGAADAGFQDDEFGALIALSSGVGNASPRGQLSVPRSSFSGPSGTMRDLPEPPQRPISSYSAKKRESRFSRIDLWR